MESKIPPEDTLSGWYDHPQRVRHFLNVGTRLEAGPSFAFTAGSTEALSEEQRAHIKSVLEQLRTEDYPGNPEG